MKPRDIKITLRVRTAAPLPVLRDKQNWPDGIEVVGTGNAYPIDIFGVEVKELEPWDIEQGEMEFGSCA